MRAIFPDSHELFAAWVTEEEWEQMAELVLPTGRVTNAFAIVAARRRTIELLRMSR